MNTAAIRWLAILLVPALAASFHGSASAQPAAAPPASEPGPAGKTDTDDAPGLRAPAKKEIAKELVSCAENSTLDWKAQYGYLEYNVEHNAKENRGYTGGIIGFTSKTHDMLELVEYYHKIAPGNGLAAYLPALRQVDGKSARTNLGKGFVRAWQAAAQDPKFREAQDHERDRTYFDPAVDQARRDGLRALGQFIYYDAIVMHGPGDGPGSFGGIRAVAMKNAKPPAQGGDEATYLNAFLDARKAAMLAEQAHGSDTTRVDTMQRVFLTAGNFDLDPPLRFKVYGDAYEIAAAPPK
jgi:chitosanase